MSTDSKSIDSQPELWRFTNVHIALAVLIAGMLIWAFYGGLERMVQRWETSEEYGYGYMIPMIVGFFIWQKKNELEDLEFTGNFFGVLLVIFGAALLVMGELSALFIVVQYAFLVTLFGVILSFTGWRVFKEILPALCLLVFMVPLPNFLNAGLSSELQLISSNLGVEVIRLFGISVFLEGNVIDLGVFKLQVVEACSGLRYLFPLAALSYMSAYLFKGAVWKKIIIFVSCAPITILMNSFRIGIIGVLVEHWGISMAEGFLHDFEGWIVFMACMVVLFLEMWLLSKVGSEKIAFADVFEIELPEPTGDASKERVIPSAFKVVVPVVLIMSLLPMIMESREEIVPVRESFKSFPMQVSEWVGRSGEIEREIIDILQFDDYLMTDYVNNRNDAINLYVAYYQSQRKGASIHSPKSCIPGGGWQIQEHRKKELALENGEVLAVNRLFIQNGSSRQLVYYWFDQRGRNMTNEYIIKWYLFWDSLTKSRTDGALVRVSTNIDSNEDVGLADERLESFTKEISSILHEYIPL